MSRSPTPTNVPGWTALPARAAASGGAKSNWSDDEADQQPRRHDFHQRPNHTAQAQIPNAPEINALLNASTAVASEFKILLEKQAGYSACTVTHAIDKKTNTVTYTINYTQNNEKKTSTAKVTITPPQQPNGPTLFTCQSDRPLAGQYRIIALQVAQARIAAGKSLDSVTISLPDVDANTPRTNAAHQLISNDKTSQPLSEKEYLAIRAFFSVGLNSVICNGKTYLAADNNAQKTNAAAVQVGKVADAVAAAPVIRAAAPSSVAVPTQGFRRREGAASNASSVEMRSMNGSKDNVGGAAAPNSAGNSGAFVSGSDSSNDTPSPRQ